MEPWLVTGRGSRQVERHEKARHVRVVVATPVRVARRKPVTFPRRRAVRAQRFHAGFRVFFSAATPPVPLS